MTTILYSRFTSLVFYILFILFILLKVFSANSASPGFSRRGEKGIL